MTDDELARIRATSEFFTACLDLIPAQFYLPREDAEHWAPKLGKNKKRKAPKQEQKEASIKGRKKAKFDPDQAKSISELQVLQKQAEPKPERPVKPSSASIEELRERLHKRIEDLRGRRRVEEHKEREPKRKTKPEAKQPKAKKAKSASATADDEALGATDEAPPPKPAAAKPIPSVRNVDLQFGKVEFEGKRSLPTTILQKERKEKHKSKAALLKQAEAEKEQMEELKGTEAGVYLAKDKAFEKSMLRAQGEKVKDSPALIKKSMKREQKLKVKSAIKWQERKKAEKESQENRAKQRIENIKNRKADKLADKKDKKDKKDKRDKKDKKDKGSKQKKSGPGGAAQKKRRPGFEGRKKSFLNAKGGS